MISCNTLNQNNDNMLYIEKYMLRYTYINFVISFKDFYTQRDFYEIWQIIPNINIYIHYFYISLCAVGR